MVLRMEERLKRKKDDRVHKKQPKEAIEDYRMYNGYSLKTVKSDTSEHYLVCKVEVYD